EEIERVHLEELELVARARQLLCERREGLEALGEEVAGALAEDAEQCRAGSDLLQDATVPFPARVLEPSQLELPQAPCRHRRQVVGAVGELTDTLERGA